MAAMSQELREIGMFSKLNGLGRTPSEWGGSARPAFALRSLAAKRASKRLCSGLFKSRASADDASDSGSGT